MSLCCLDSYIDYFKVEFGGKEQGKIEFKNIIPIPFWSDIM